ncbi:hypothetical protein Si004_01177 [Streptococcus infantarius subsp. infantarius]|nr:hypothetical protein [Streptococcus infantarius subsp. infantarius]MCO4656163.1 hypothetical protein [Streptococcus infantarius subsp. infantarius]MCO4658200.1 hypothetical protein [Streptococcus infantarius subsp. infantarius]MCO4658368.1 hypothetical protein [Streptococcus infantarius subsp. infantarius]MCO4663096.1 hypothetical protein [Streptococcus infantarius subsp. infantarius]
MVHAKVNDGIFYKQTALMFHQKAKFYFYRYPIPAFSSYLE